MIRTHLERISKGIRGVVHIFQVSPGSHNRAEVAGAPARQDFKFRTSNLHDCIYKFAVILTPICLQEYYSISDNLVYSTVHQATFLSHYSGFSNR